MTPCVNQRRHLVRDGERKGQHDGTLAADDTQVCRSCARRLERGIAEMPAVSRWLALNVARNGALGEPLSGSRDAPIPVSLDILALLGPVGHDCSSAPHQCPPKGHDPLGAGQPSIAGVLDSWARLVCEERGLVGPRDAKVENLATWLLAQLPWSLTQPWVDELAGEVDRLHGRAHSLAPWIPPHEQPRPVPCRECEMVTLYWRPPWVECDSCGVLLSQAEYDEWVGINAAYYAGRLVS